ncbi:hypothetical protein HUK80_17505, partial [Flavobacterium sp. MAH-1]|nr:hypothetical protein [Flavobacterium agri]NYA72726.1 hypothetical protein [Flavobacterium agri]
MGRVSQRFLSRFSFFCAGIALLACGISQAQENSFHEKQLKQGIAIKALYDAYVADPTAEASYFEVKDSEIGLANHTSVGEEAYIQLSANSDMGNYTYAKTTITLKIWLYTSTGSLSATSSDYTMEVEYNPAQNSANFVDKAYHRISNRYGLRCQVVNISTLTTTSTVTDVEPNIDLEIGFKCTRYYALSQTLPLVNHSLHDDTNELSQTSPVAATLSWSAIPGATGYEVEWAWVDNFGEPSTNGAFTPMDPGQIKFSNADFDASHTRITTKELSYEIPLIYQSGYLVYRVRALGKYNNQNLWPVYYGPWSSGTTAKTFVSEWAKISISADHERAKNWQFTASFAEEGKKKELVNYFDGSLHNRQTVSKINTDNTAIAGETIYDNEGRGVIQVLPVPLKGKNYLRYFSRLNRNMANLPYSHRDFDWSPDNPEIPSVCMISAGGMIDNSGASLYYSGNNAFTSVNSDYIPKANNYPFSQTEYTSDGTGRIKRQGGVGQVHQLGNRHETRYYYPDASQVELDRLFGYHIGHESFYKKTAVVDPNGQITLSYIDLKGQTVATAMAGDAPATLQALDETTNGDHHDITVDLLNNNNPGDHDSPSDNNILSSSGHFATNLDRLTLDKSIFSAGTINHFFDYRIDNPSSFTPAFCDDKYAFVYRLRLSLIDECQNTIFNVDPDQDNDSGIRIGTPNFGTSPALMTPQQFPSATPYSLVTGEYSLFKELSVDQQALEEYADHYIEQIRDSESGAGCYINPNAFAPQDVTGNCTPQTCEQCLAALPTKEAFVIAELEESFPGHTFTVNLTDEPFTANATPALPTATVSLAANMISGFIYDWSLRNAECERSCLDVAAFLVAGCEVDERSLITDLSPFGQYGKAETTLVADQAVITDKLSIFNDIDGVLFSQGTTTNHNWRYPVTPYRDEEGIPSEIEVVLNTESTTPGQYIPEVVAGVITSTLVSNQPVWPQTATIRPEQLKNVSDFLNVYWKPSFAKSLLEYHPEFCYLEYSRELCAKTKSVDMLPALDAQPSDAVARNLTSDEFDGYLQYLSTYESAMNAGLASASGISVDVIYEKDPYFSLQLGAGFETADEFDARKSIMIEALTEEYEDHGANNTMLLEAFKLTMCTSINPCQITTVDFSQLNTAKLKNNFWNTYKNLYIALKGKIKNTFMNLYAKKQGCYNGCIGIAESPSITNVIRHYDAASDVLDWFNPGAATQLCDNANADLYLEKVKRFPPSDVLYDSSLSTADAVAQLEAQTDYAVYAQTGNCPLLVDMDLFLEDYFTNLPNAILSSPQPLSQSLPLDLFRSMTGISTNLSSPTSVTFTTANSGKRILFGFSGLTTSAQMLQIDLPTSGTAQNLTWSNYGPGASGWTILELKQMYYDATASTLVQNASVYGFQVIAMVSINGSSDLKEVLLKGVTKAAIGECGTVSGNQFGQVLDPNSATNSQSPGCDRKHNFKTALVHLMNALQQDGVLFSTADVALNNYPEYTNGFLRGFFSEPAGAVTSVWKMGTGSFKIVRGTEILMEFQISFSSLPSTFNQFEGMNISTVSGQNVTLSYTNQDASIGYLYGAFKKLINFSCCGSQTDIVPYFWLRKMVDGIAANDKFTYTDLFWEPHGISIPVGQAFDIEIDIDKHSLAFSTLAQDYTAKLWINGQMYPLSFSTTTSLGTVRLHKRHLNRLSWSQYYGNAFDLSRLEYTVNGFQREFTFDNTSAPYTSSGSSPVTMYNNTGDGEVALSTTMFDSPINDYALVLDGLDAHKSAVWSDTAYSLDLDKTMELNVKARLKYTDNLYTYSSGGSTYGYGTTLQLNSDANGGSILYELGILAENPNAGLCTPCVPQTVAPKECGPKYAEYISYLNFNGQNSQKIENILLDEVMSEDEFCANNFQYLIDDYKYYTDRPQLAITSTESHYYLTLAEFGNTFLNYGYSGMHAAVDAYVAYLGTTLTNEPGSDDEPAQHLDWNDYINTIYQETNAICPPARMPVPTIVIPAVNECQEMVSSIIGVYQNENYEAYLQQLRDAFIRDYINAAMQTVAEKFDMTYADKEYQYTLYYYDQAGNLIKTVAPQGVKRMSDTSGIDTYRNANTAANHVAEDNGLLPQHNFDTQYRYNSLNQLVWQKTPDAGESRFAYDALGRIIASQNAKQGNTSMSYTTYDELGRIVEAGEITFAANAYTINGEGKLLQNGSTTPINTFGTFSTKRQVTVTRYDGYTEIYPPGTTYLNGFYSSEFMITPTDALNMRNRVSGVLYYEQLVTTPEFDNGIFYNYDVHGNVKEMVNYYKHIKSPEDCFKEVNHEIVIIPCEDHLKRTVYDYDLISGNVKQVTYQPAKSGEQNKKDLFIHRYAYDADNRITDVQTSRDGVLWEKDAAYQYYPHGPLAKTLIGEKKVQGIDYAYTLQGWLKMVNGEDVANPTDDMGKDGVGNTINKDAFGYSLNYYDAVSQTPALEADYRAIRQDDGSSNFAPLKYSRNASIQPGNQNLYNGNIKKMVTSMRKVGEDRLPVQVNKYQYDQLNRIYGMTSSKVVNNVATSSYASSYTYDKNGNLYSMSRTNDSGVTFDTFSYKYNSDTEGLHTNNKLRLVKDSAAAALATDDIDDQEIPGMPYSAANAATHNYIYDAIGQMVQDKSEGLTVTWRVDGKVKSIANSIKDTRTDFEYDGLGNRIAKIEYSNIASPTETARTYYSRDAQGNVLAVYDVKDQGGMRKIYLAENHIYGSSRLGMEVNNSLVSEIYLSSQLRNGGKVNKKQAAKDVASATDANPVQTAKGASFASLTPVDAASLVLNALHIATGTTATWQQQENTALEGLFADYSVDTKFKTDPAAANGDILIGKAIYVDQENESRTYDESVVILSGAHLASYTNMNTTSITNSNIVKETDANAASGEISSASGLHGSGRISWLLNSTASVNVELGISDADDNNPATKDFWVQTTATRVFCYAGSTLLNAGGTLYAMNDEVSIVRNTAAGTISFELRTSAGTTPIASTSHTSTGEMYIEFTMTAGSSSKRIYNLTVTNKSSATTNEVSHTFTSFGTGFNQIAAVTGATITNGTFPNTINNTTASGMVLVSNNPVMLGDGYIERTLDADQNTTNASATTMGLKISTNPNGVADFYDNCYAYFNTTDQTLRNVFTFNAGALVTAGAGITFGEGDRLRIERRQGKMYFKRITPQGAVHIYHTQTLTTAQNTAPLYLRLTLPTGKNMSDVRVVNYIPSNETRNKLTGQEVYAVKSGTAGNYTYSPKIIAYNEQWRFNDNTFGKNKFTYTTSASITQAQMNDVGMQVNFTRTAATTGQFVLNNTVASASQATTNSSSSTAGATQSQLGPGTFDICWFNYSFGANAAVHTSFDFGSSSTVSPIPSTETGDTNAMAVSPAVVKVLGPCLFDSDHDGIYDIFENVNANNDLADDDTDGDGTPNYLDPDDDGDAVWTVYEGVNPDGDGNPATGATLDTDGDAIPNYLDADDDNDGYPTWEETDNSDNDFNPNTGVSPNADGDSIPDYLDATDSTFYPPGVSVLADYYNVAGDKRYELSNHLGDVLVVINDKKIRFSGDSEGVGAAFNADIISYSDYYPFGMLQKER